MSRRLSLTVISWSPGEIDNSKVNLKMAHLTRALVVDDNDDHSEMLAMLLRRKGYEAETASSGAEALEKCATGSFDLIISDVGMPVMNGYELARQLRLLPECKTAVLLAVTGYSIFGDRNRARNAGFDDLIAKPIGPRTLIAWVERLLKSRK
jgi:CheY-like chemotaxis protein